MSQAKATRKNSETVHKPYRSNQAFYTDYREEVPDADYYGLKHSEFKKPWLPASGYDEMEYKFDYPLEYLNPNYEDFELPDMGKYKFPDASTVNPDWTPTRWNPQYPPPDFPKPKENAKKKPGENQGSKIVWLYCEGVDFQYCPGETISVQFVEYTTDPIVSVNASGAQIIPTAFGRLGASSHRPGYPEGTFSVTVKIPDTVGPKLEITAITESGDTCVSKGTRRSSCMGGCEGVSIAYTTTTMQTGETQSLTVSNPVAGTEYEWQLDGPGALSQQRGLGTIYQAPATNPNCGGATIRLMDYNTRQMCDSVTFAINAYTDLTKVAFREANNDYRAMYVCAAISPYPCHVRVACLDGNEENRGFAITYACTFTEYACDGSPLKVLQRDYIGCPTQESIVLTEKQRCSSYSTACCGDYCDKCGDANNVALGLAEQTKTHCINTRGPWGDVRTQAMKDSGCCPSQLL